MSNVCARMLIAGTVKPDDLAAAAGQRTAPGCSPRARRERGLPPTRATARPRSSPRRAERCGPGEVADGGVAEGRLVVDDQAVAVEVGGGADGRQEVGGLVATWGMRSAGLLALVARSTMVAGVRPRRGRRGLRPSVSRRGDGLTTIRNTITTIRPVEHHPAALDRGDLRRQAGRRTLRVRRRRGRGQVDDLAHVPALDEDREVRGRSRTARSRAAASATMVRSGRGR